MTGANNVFTPKQREVWRNTVNTYHRWNISYGATRSGKTYLDYFKLPYRIRAAGNEGLILLLGNTKGTLERNILEPMRKIWSPRYVGCIGSDNTIELFGRKCWALGADNIAQVSKLQGSGLSYCYGDEIQTWHEDVFTMLKSRMDKPGACFDGTSNPDHPKHWFKKFLDSDIDAYQMQFTIDDNPFNDPEFVKNLKKEYKGTVYYDRYILGKWVAAEGAVYRLFADNPERYIIDEVPGDLGTCIVGVDFGGNKSAHAFQLTGFSRDLRRVITLDEEYTKKPIDPASLDKEFVDFILRNRAKGYRIVGCYADSAEQLLIRGMNNALIRAGIDLEIQNALKGPINDRIRFYCALMGADRYQVMRNCRHTIDAFSTAVWNPKKFEDSRLDDGTTNIDTLDAQEYSTESIQKELMDMILMGR